MVQILKSKDFLSTYFWSQYEKTLPLIQTLETLTLSLNNSLKNTPFSGDMEKIKSSVEKFDPLLHSLTTLSSEGQDSTFWSRLRHDLKTPLNAIRGYTEMILEDLPAEEPSVPSLKEMLHLCEKISKTLGAFADPSSTTKTFEEKERLESQTLVSSLTLTLEEKSEILKGSFLVVDDQEANQDVLKHRLENEGHQVFCVGSGQEALQFLKNQDVDIILLDLVMPQMNGFEVLKELKKDHNLHSIPVIMISAIDEMDKIATCIEAGAEDYLPKPFNPALLRARIGACLEKKVWAQKLSENQKILQTAIENMEYGFAVFNQEGICTLRNQSIMNLYPTLFTEDHAPQTYKEFLEGITSQKLFLEEENWQEILLTMKPGDTQTQNHHIINGKWIQIHETLTKEGNRVIIHKDITDQKSDEERLSFMAFHDPLTGLANRQEFHNQLNKIIGSDSPNRQCAILFCDLDGFKQVNDQFGHEFGDVLLKHVAHQLSDAVRHGDLVARLGGDEFSIILTRYGTTQEVEKIVQRLFQHVGTRLLHEGHEMIFGMSVGISFFPKDGSDGPSVLAKADQAMYQAKKAGKGTYRFASQAS